MKKLSILFGAIFFLFVISTGAWAAPPAKDVNCDLPCINSYEIEDGAVGSDDITDGTVDTADIADGAITDAKITGPISRGNLETASNRVVVAQSGGDYTTITDALNSIAPSAANPFVIDVMPGTYIEDVTMKSYVHLRGAGRDVTTIQATSTSNSVVTIDTLTGVTVSGLTLRDGRNGILCNESSPTIMGNTIDGNNEGINNYYLCHGVITDNIITGNGEGILNEESSPMIIGNQMTGNLWEGIWNTQNSNPLISGNVISNSDWDGIVNDNWSSPIIEGNVISGNVNYAIANFDGSEPVITGNTLTGNGSQGIYASGGPKTVIEGNTILDNGEEGIYVRSYAITIIGNTIRGNLGDGVRVNNLASPALSHNKITGNGGGTYSDINVNSGTPNISFNIYDTITGSGTGAYNVKSDGTPW